MFDTAIFVVLRLDNLWLLRGRPEGRDVVKIKNNYAWGVCAACFMLHFFFCGMITTGISVHAQYLRDELGLMNAQVSMISTLRCLSTVVTLRYTERYYRRFSLRNGLFINCLLFVGILFGFAYVSSVWVLYALSIFLGVTYALGGTIPITILLRRWFDTSGVFLSASLSLWTIRFAYHSDMILMNGARVNRRKRRRIRALDSRLPAAR